MSLAEGQRANKGAVKYVLVNKKTGERIELGPCPILTESQIEEHTLNLDTWDKYWDFKAEKV